MLGKISAPWITSVRRAPSPSSRCKKKIPVVKPPPEDEHQFEPLEHQGPAAEQCPRPLQFAVLAFLHLFSGARRPGDVQDELERVLVSGHVTIIIISCDVACDGVNGDLTRSDI
eukprot:88925-Pyramimonas_sp.AAC.1